MALFAPPAIRKLIPPGDNDPRIKVVGLVLHVRDGLGDSLYDFFNGPSGGIESHSYTRFTGVEEQYRDTAFEADANLDGNSFDRGGTLCGLASMETEGLAAGKWTEAQLTTIKRRILWYNKTHGVPLRLIDAWNGSGIGYHTMWGSPSHWTPVAKSCPGPDRIVQFKQIIVPWLEAGAPPPDQPWPVKGDVGDAVRAMQAKLAANGYGIGKDTAGMFGAGTQAAIVRLQREFEDTKADADGVIGPLTWKHIQALPDKPEEPPVHETLLDKWQKATGDVRDAQKVAVAAGQAFVTAQPNRPVLAAVLDRQNDRGDAEAADWAVLHDAAQ